MHVVTFRRVTHLLLLLLLAYAALAVFAWLLADRMMFLPPPPSYGAERVPVVFAETDDGARIALLHLPAASDRFTIIFSHGNAEDLGHVLPALQLLNDAGFGVIGFDYRGYGLSTGGPPTARGRSGTSTPSTATRCMDSASHRIASCSTAALLVRDLPPQWRHASPLQD